MLKTLFTEQRRGQLAGHLARTLRARIRLAALGPLVWLTLTTLASAAGPPSVRQRMDALERSHDTIISHYEVGLALIAALLTLVGLLFPIVIYFTTILPTKREVQKVADLENRLEDKFNKFLESAEGRRFNLLVEKATGRDPDARREAAMRLWMEDNTWLTEQHIAALRAAIEDEKDLDVRAQLTRVALSKRTRHGDGIVRDIMEDKKKTGLLGPALSYIAHNPVPQLEGLINRKLEGAKDAVNVSVPLLGAAVTNHETMTFLLRLPVWRTALSRVERALLLTHLNSWVLSGYMTKDDLRASAWDDVMGRIIIFPKKAVDGTVIYSELPDGALFAQVFEDGALQAQLKPDHPGFQAIAEEAKSGQANVGSEAK